MELIDEVKAALRVKSNDDGILAEINTLILAAESDLISCGIIKPTNYTSDSASLFRMAVIMYCKANFGYDNPDAPRFAETYTWIKHKMMHTEEYRDEI